MNKSESKKLPFDQGFHDKYNINQNGCWEWRFYLNKCGYGIYRGSFLAHRASWIIHFGEITQGLHVLHKCDNPKCVNPDHLFLGTHSDNMVDMYKKSRHKNHFSKEQNPKAKLNQEIADEIRKLQGAYDTKFLAAKFGVHRSTIYKIFTNKVW